jgi:hypothetical protein
MLFFRVGQSDWREDGGHPFLLYIHIIYTIASHKLELIVFDDEFPGTALFS